MAPGWVAGNWGVDTAAGPPTAAACFAVAASASVVALVSSVFC